MPCVYPNVSCSKNHFHHQLQPTDDHAPAPIRLDPSSHSIIIYRLLVMKLLRLVAPTRA